MNTDPTLFILPPVYRDIILKTFAPMSGYPILVISKIYDPPKHTPKIAPKRLGVHTSKKH